MTKKTSKLEKTLDHYIGKLIVEKELIKNGDSILVGLSGGKDSWTLAYFLKKFQAKAPIRFELGVATLDVMFSNKQKEILKKGVGLLGLEYFVIENRIEEIIKKKRQPGTSYCSFCARLRRAYLYKACQELGYNKLALGHHFDDFVETFMMNIFYHGRVKGMPAHINAKNGVNELIRPLLYCPENAISRFAKEQKFHLLYFL